MRIFSSVRGGGEVPTPPRAPAGGTVVVTVRLTAAASRTDGARANSPSLGLVVVVVVEETAGPPERTTK